MNKKIIFGIALFFLLGFLMITFANPDENEESKKDNTKTSEISDSKEKNKNKKKEVIEVVENDNDINDLLVNNMFVQNQIPLLNNNVNLQDNFNNNDNNNSNDSSENDVLAEEVTNNLENAKKEAIEEIENYKKDELYSDENQELIDKIKEEAKEKINDAKEENEIREIVENAKEEIDNIERLIDTKYNVAFVDLNNDVIKEEKVLYDTAATAPIVLDITKNNITYVFNNWDKEFSNVKSDLVIKANYNINKVYANIYLNDKVISKVELNIAEEIENIIKENKNVELSNIENIVKDSLPTSTKQNYKYIFSSLKYDKNNGFSIEANEVIDEEELKKNTVTVTYKLDDKLKGYKFEGNKTIITSTVTTGKNEINKLPKVFKGKKEIAVIWKDSNNNVISNISVNKINLNVNPTVYKESTVLTATLDDVAPTITLKGDSNIKVEYSEENEYKELGYTATDNFLGDITNKVEKIVTHNGVKTNKVSYDIVGEYVITYFVSDNEGNKTEVSRTIVVEDPIKEIKAKVKIKNNENDREYANISEVNLVIQKVRKYIGGKTTVIATKNIETYIIDGINALPALEKYYYYELNSLSYNKKTGFSIEGIKKFDRDAYKNDRLNKLYDLLNKDYSEYKDTKTTDSYNNLIKVIKENKKKHFNTIEKIEKAIKEITDAINGLVNLEIESLVLSRNNDTYSINENMHNVSITAIYNDSIRNKVLSSNEYSISNSFDSKTPGNKTIVYSYKGITVTYNYTVNYSQEYLTNIISNIGINIKRDRVSKNDYINYIEFNNINNINVQSIRVEKNNKVIRNIEFDKNQNNNYVISHDDYIHLKNNNTIINNKYIMIDYVIDNQIITAKYYELSDKLYFIKIN